MVSNDLVPSRRINQAAFPPCFYEKLGFCSFVEHEITTSPNFVPKPSKPYKIPEPLTDEVDRQIGVLLKDVYIRPLTSPTTSHIVCVLKKQQNEPQIDEATVKTKPELCLTVEFCYLNSFTQQFQFPVPN